MLAPSPDAPWALPDDGDGASISSTVPIGALLPLQPGLLTETHAAPVTETVPTGVSALADTEASICEDTGTTGAEISVVSVAAVFVPVVVKFV